MKFWIRMGPVALVLGLLIVPAVSREASPEPFVSATTDCPVFDGSVANPYTIASFFTLPNRPIELTVMGRHASGGHQLEVAAGLVEARGDGWQWMAPSVPGLYTGTIRHAHSQVLTTVNFFVLVPSRQIRNGRLDGYAIGRYPRPMAGREALYQSPVGFVQVTRENENTLVAPHFTLKQFLCKQESGYPKYVFLEERLLVALETILEGVNREGFAASSLFVMSGYRTPVYNRAIGNVANSRHVFGDAADIFIDQNPADGVMDDLNGDGRSNRRDNEVLARIVEESLNSYARDIHPEAALEGGIGSYPRNAVHGPFVHIDLRGYRARW